MKRVCLVTTGQPSTNPRLVKEADANGTSPGKEVLKTLLKMHAPCVVLIDELVAYIRQFPEFVQQCIASIRVVDVNRRTLDGKHPDGWIPEQKIGPVEALRAYTTKAAFAAFEENEKGSLAPGRLGDFVILSGDPVTVAPARLDGIRVETTVVGGRVVFPR